MSFERMLPKRLSGDEQFHSDGGSLGFGVLQYWQWAASDIVSNKQRANLAEFLVAQSLGVGGEVKSDWSAFDLESTTGVKVEVKASGLLQAWSQTKLSSPRFDIEKKRSWNADTGKLGEVPCRPAEVYVFALHAHEDQETLDVLNVDQWEFYVLNRIDLDMNCGGQKSIGLSSLKKLCSCIVSFRGLGSAIVQASGG